MLSNISYPSLWEETLGARQKQLHFPLSQGEFKMDTFGATKTKPGQDYNTYRREIPIPLDLTLLNKTVHAAKRDTDSPLDLSLKTRKRCADTTDIDENIVFLNQGYGPKRSCYEKGTSLAKGNSNFMPNSEHSIGLYGTTGTNGLVNSRAYDSLHNNGNHETMASKSPFQHVCESRPIPRSFSMQQQAPGNHIPQTDPPSFQHIPRHNSRECQTPSAQIGNVQQFRQRDFLNSASKMNVFSSYASSPVNPSVNVATSKSTVHSTHQPPTHPRQLYHGPQSYSSNNFQRNGPPHAQFSQSVSPGSVSSSNVNQRVFPLSQVTRFPSEGIPKTMPFSGPPMIVQSVSMHNQSRPSELRAALSSRDRYYPRLTSMVPTPLAVSQRCSPDSTFAVTSAQVQLTVAPLSSSPVVKVTSVSGLCGAEVTAKPHSPAPQRTLTGMDPPFVLPRTKSPNIWTQSFVSKLTSNQVEHRALVDQIVVLPETSHSDKNEKTQNMSSGNEITKKPSCPVGNGMVTSYSIPLSIAIPSDNKQANVTTSTKPEHQHPKPTSRNPKLTCKKHIILDAVNQDKDLKMLTIQSLTRSPPACNSDTSEQPPSPKMPILSPQHQIPLPLYSPLTNDPPSLEPTTATRAKDDNILCVPDGSAVYGVRKLAGCTPAVVVSPVSREDGQSSRFALGIPAFGGTANLNASGSVRANEDNRNIPNISAFIQTPNGKISPVRLKSKGDLTHERSSNANGYSEHNDELFSGSCTNSSVKSSKLTDWRSGHRVPFPKVIPVANVAPMIHTNLNTDSNDTRASDHASKCSKTSESKVVDLQAEIAAYKSSLRMPAKLMPRSSNSTEGMEWKQKGIAEKFGASESRFKHINGGKKLTNLRAIYGKLFGAKELTKCHIRSAPSLRVTEAGDKCSNIEKKERNIWQSISESDKGMDSFEDLCLSADKTDVNDKECGNTIYKECEDSAMPSFPEGQFTRLKTVKPTAKKFLMRSNSHKRAETPTKFKVRPSTQICVSDRGPGQRQDYCKIGSLQDCGKLHKRHRRSMLDEIANSDGYVGERKVEEKPLSVDLFADPALLSREERALQKAMMRFTEMEARGLKRPRVVHQKQQSSSRQRADQLKRKALRHSPQKKGNGTGSQKHYVSPCKKGFVDFQPEVLSSRTRMQSKGCHSVGGYNRDRAYENELKNDERRRELKRARRMAHQMAHQRAAVRRFHREQNLEAGTLRETTKQKEGKVSESKTTPISPRTSRLLKLKEQNLDAKKELTFAKPILRDMMKKEPVTLDHVDELPDLVEEVKTVDNAGCWEVRNLASSDSLSQTLRSGRKKGGILMKLSWRPTTASSKGKPRIAHARVSSTKRRASKSARMLQLRRRAKLAYLQATGKERGEEVTKTRKITAPRRNVKVPILHKNVKVLGRNVKIPRRNVKIPRRNTKVLGRNVKIPRRNVKISRRNIKVLGRNVKIPRRNTKVLGRNVKIPRRNVKISRRNIKVLGRNVKIPPRKIKILSRNAKFQKSLPKSTRYPLRDQTPKKESGVAQDVDDDGNTTEEYEFEDIVEEEEYRVYSDDDSVYDDAMNAESDGLLFDDMTDYAEPPELRKLSVNINKNSGETLLHRAARLGYEDVVLHCLQSGMVEANARDNAGYTALHECCVGGHSAIARHLLSHGADPNCCSQDGIRCAPNCLTTVERLVSYMYSEEDMAGEIIFEDFIRPIQGPLENNNVDIVRLLLSYGADQLLATTDEKHSREMSVLLNGYLGDINGYTKFGNEIPWEFYGSAIIEEEQGVDGDLFSAVPSDEEDEELDSLFQWCDTEPLLSYKLKIPEADSEDSYLILLHVLSKYQMTRAGFLRELGHTVRIYSLSRYTFEENIMHASSISLPLSLEMQSQTVELIRLADLDMVEARKSAPAKGKQSLTKRRTGSSYKRAKRQIFDLYSDDCEPNVPSQEFSLETTSDDEALTGYNNLPVSIDSQSEADCQILPVQNVDRDKHSEVRRNKHSNHCATHFSSVVEDTLSVINKEKYSEPSRAVPELMSSTDRLLTLNESVTPGLVCQHGTIESTKSCDSEEWIQCVNKTVDMTVDLVNNNKRSRISLLDSSPCTKSLNSSHRFLEIDR